MAKPQGRRTREEIDVGEGTRELVDLSAEAVGALGVHLAQIGSLIAKSVMPPGRGDRGTGFKVREKLDLYKEYSDDVLRRKAIIEAKIAAEYAAMREWRKEAGTEGADLVTEIEALYSKVRQLKGELKEEREHLEEEREKVRGLVELGEKKDRKWAALSEAFVKRIESKKTEAALRAGVCSWLQSAFAEIRYKFKAAQEREKLRIEHHQKMRKARAQARIDVIQRERAKRLIQACMLALQEESVESRGEKHLEELRRRHEDATLVLEAQLAQALGDEEKAKELVAEQVRRIEAAKAEAKEAERKMRLAQREAREARADAERSKADAEKARQEAAAEKARRERAEEEAESSKKEAEDANLRAEASELAREKAEQAQRDAEEQVRKKNKKIQSLQRMLAELGAESDSDAPPDERPPAFFVNEDGTKVPRPRTRKERMGMAFREAESARWELRIGMAAMVEKDVANLREIERLKLEVLNSKREISEVRWANNVLVKDVETAAAAAEAANRRADTLAAAVASREFEASAARRACASDATCLRLEDWTHAPPPSPPTVPFAPSTPAAPPYSPTRPHFAAFGASQGGFGATGTRSPMGNTTGSFATASSPSSPRLQLLRPSSQPALSMPPLYSAGDLSRPASRESAADSRAQPLAPLRKLRQKAVDWRVGWH